MPDPIPVAMIKSARSLGTCFGDWSQKGM